jgi:hypothetical protein
MTTSLSAAPAQMSGLLDTSTDLDESRRRKTPPAAAKVQRSERVRQRSYYPSRREAFVESAAMDREMYRL